MPHKLGQNSCNHIYIIGKNNTTTTMKVKDIHKDNFLKALSKILFSKFNAHFTKENTIIIDHSALRHMDRSVLDPRTFVSQCKST